MCIISKELLAQLREEDPEGARVVLVKMTDGYSKLKPGDQGTVKCIDDIGTIHVSWDCGSSLGIVYGEDKCSKIA